MVTSYILFLRRYFTVSDNTFVDYRFFKISNESHIQFPLKHCHSIICYDSDDERIEISDRVFTNIKNVGVNLLFNQDNDNTNEHFNQLKKFCGIPMSTKRIQCSVFPWERNPSEFSIDINNNIKSVL